MLAFIRRHPYSVGAGAVLVVAGLAWLAFGFFAVQTLFIDDVVDEAAPTFDASPASVIIDTDSTPQTTVATEPDESAPSVSPEPAQPTPPTATVPTPTVPAVVTEYEGVFQGDAHPTAGTASVLGNGTGQRFLRLTEFETDNGPDLNVYLVNSSTGDVSDFIDLGDLEGNIGDQNYEIPEDVDLEVYDEVVIWCVRFGVGFGDAMLMAT